MSDTPLVGVVAVCIMMGAVTYLVGSGGGAVENIWRKARLAAIGALHMLFSKDKRLKIEARLPCN